MIERNVHTPGRKPKQIPANLLRLYENHTTTDLAEKFGVSRATVCRWLKIKREEELTQR